ncbi:MAG TPA: hypothetical protein VN982_10405 [Candidatus Dormibacteraeota bacterium]|nr:hypothetical protein [Candidatus Dormibacteraeota bacterium]
MQKAAEAKNPAVTEIAQANPDIQPATNVERRWSKDVLLAALGLIVEYLAIQFGHHWLKWGGAALLGYAVWERTTTVSSKWKRYAINAAAATALLTGAYLVGADKFHRADVTLSSINIVPGPPAVLQAQCENDSDYVANDELCLIGWYEAPIVNGKVPVDEQEEYFKDMLEQFKKADLDSKTLEPRKQRLLHAKLEITPGMWHDFQHQERTILAAGLIFWSDEAGPHRKEFCKWLAPPDLEQLQTNYRQYPLCKSHNKILY